MIQLIHSANVEPFVELHGFQGSLPVDMILIMIQFCGLLCYVVFIYHIVFFSSNQMNMYYGNNKALDC